MTWPRLLVHIQPARQVGRLTIFPTTRFASRRTDHDEQLFQLVASASFIEVTTRLLRARDLVEYFRRQRGSSRGWSEVWEKEELQHGEALKRFVQTAWPDFDWDAAYRGTSSPNTRHSALSIDLRPRKALEMTARCVVETGTASFYRALSACCHEPVLQYLAGRLATDEIRHYKRLSLFPQLPLAGAETVNGRATNARKKKGGVARLMLTGRCSLCLQGSVPRAPPGGPLPYR